MPNDKRQEKSNGYKCDKCGVTNPDNWCGGCNQVCEHICICDCLPCKTDCCENCNVDEVSKSDWKKNSMCHEGCC